MELIVIEQSIRRNPSDLTVPYSAFHPPRGLGARPLPRVLFTLCARVYTVQFRVVYTIYGYEKVVYRIPYIVYNDIYTRTIINGNIRNIRYIRVYDTYTKYMKIYEIVSIISVSAAVTWYGKDCEITRNACSWTCYEHCRVSKNIVEGKAINYNYFYDITRFGIWQNLRLISLKSIQAL